MFVSFTRASTGDQPIENATMLAEEMHGWLRDNVYRHGRKFKPDDLIERATGGPMSIAPYIAYLRGKYGELYRLPPAKALGRQPRAQTISPSRRGR